MAASSIKYRLGLDMGTNSIGWAAVKLGEDGEPGGLLDWGFAFSRTDAMSRVNSPMLSIGVLRVANAVGGTVICNVAVI